MNVKLFTRNNCAACMGTKNFLKTRNIPFEEINVEEDETRVLAQQLVDEGWGAMPVVKVFDGDTEIDSWQGSKPDKLRTLIAG